MSPMGLPTAAKLTGTFLVPLSIHSCLLLSFESLTKAKHVRCRKFRGKRYETMKIISSFSDKKIINILVENPFMDITQIMFYFISWVAAAARAEDGQGKTMFYFTTS